MLNITELYSPCSEKCCINIAFTIHMEETVLLLSCIYNRLTITKYQRKDCQITDSPSAKTIKSTLLIFILKYLARIRLVWTTYGNNFPGNSKLRSY